MSPRAAQLRWLAAPLLAAATMAGAAPAPAALDGQALYHEKCFMCHGPGGMGTGLLARRVQPAELAKRTNLTRAQIIAVVRSGLNNMPPLSRGEVSNPQLAAIAGYLTGPKEGR